MLLLRRIALDKREVRDRDLARPSDRSPRVVPLATYCEGGGDGPGCDVYRGSSPSTTVASSPIASSASSSSMSERARSSS